MRKPRTTSARLKGRLGVSRHVLVKLLCLAAALLALVPALEAGGFRVTYSGGRWGAVASVYSGNAFGPRPCFPAPVYRPLPTAYGGYWPSGYGHAYTGYLDDYYRVRVYRESVNELTGHTPRPQTAAPAPEPKLSTDAESELARVLAELAPRTAEPAEAPAAAPVPLSPEIELPPSLARLAELPEISAESAQREESHRVTRYRAW